MRKLLVTAVFLAALTCPAWAGELVWPAPGAPPCGDTVIKDGVLQAVNNDPYAIKSMLTAIQLQPLEVEDADAKPTDNKRHCTGVVTFGNSRRLILDYRLLKRANGGVNIEIHGALPDCDRRGRCTLTSGPNYFPD